jgi:rhodanese-related sulfurtransferase
MPRVLWLTARPMHRMTIEELLDRARARLDRVQAADAPAAVAEGALLVDIRSELQRERDGLIPGARFHPRNVLEWRADPASGYSDPALSSDLGRRLVLVCDEGYQSSLAAVTLQDLGFARATDLVGGFQAWRAAGLPVDHVALTTHQEVDRRGANRHPRRAEQGAPDRA